MSAAPKAPAPWGSPPTPLLPRWYIETYTSIPLPAPLMQAGTRAGTPSARLRSLGDITTFWEHRSTPINYDLLLLLVDLVENRWPPSNYVVVPTGTDSARLLACPLRKRTKNCLARALNLGNVRSDTATTVGELGAIPNFGIMSLLDLLCITEAALDTGFLRVGGTDVSPRPAEPSTDSPPAPPADGLPAPPADGLPAPPADGLPAPPADGLPALGEGPIKAAERSPADGDQTTDAWNPARLLLSRLLRASRDFRGAHTVGDALAGDLVGLAAALGITDDLDGILISDIAGGITLAEEALLAIVAWQRGESLSPVERLVLERRILTWEPATLAAIGHTTNLSRERIRQLEKPLRAAVESTVGQPMGAIATLMHEQLGPVVSEGDIEEHISSTFSTTISPDATEEATDLARQLLRAQLGYSCKDRICLGREAIAVVGDLQGAARSLADDVGLVDENILRTRLPDECWQKHWDVLVDCSDLHRLNGHLALRSTAKAQVKAALLTIGRPATKKEVAELCGLPPDRTGAQLSLLPYVVRADKTRWGLTEWIDDEYEGIPAEIVQRIEEDGGSTRLDRLLDEIPRRFGVSESSVKAYVDTPAFRTAHGWVSLADDAPIAVGRFEDVSDGCDGNGDPYWTFPMHERYLRGYSIPGIPLELAVALECRLGGRTTATVQVPADTGAISVIWRKTSFLGPEIGRAANALAAIAARDGDAVCIVVHSSDEVSFVPFETLRTLRGVNADYLQSPPQPRTDESGRRVGGRKSTGVRVARTVRGMVHTTGDAQTSK